MHEIVVGGGGGLSSAHTTHKEESPNGFLLGGGDSLTRLHTVKSSWQTWPPPPPPLLGWAAVYSSSCLISQTWKNCYERINTRRKKRERENLLAAITFPFFSFCIYIKVSLTFSQLIFYSPTDGQMIRRSAIVVFQFPTTTTDKQQQTPFVRSFVPSFSFLLFRFCLFVWQTATSVYGSTHSAFSLSPTNLSLLFSSSSFLDSLLSLEIYSNSFFFRVPKTKFNFSPLFSFSHFLAKLLSQHISSYPSAQ